MLPKVGNLIELYMTNDYVNKIINKKSLINIHFIETAYIEMVIVGTNKEKNTFDCVSEDVVILNIPIEDLRFQTININKTFKVGEKVDVFGRFLNMKTWWSAEIISVDEHGIYTIKCDSMYIKQKIYKRSFNIRKSNK